VHTASDALKALLGGADAVQVVSVVLKHGPHILATLNNGIGEWMARWGYTEIADFRGMMNLARCPSPGDFERANYIRILQRWRI
jgi:dihydroorotate dehydrogenase (fumarate)